MLEMENFPDFFWKNLVPWKWHSGTQITTSRERLSMSSSISPLSIVSLFARIFLPILRFDLSISSFLSLPCAGQIWCRVSKVVQTQIVMFMHLLFVLFTGIVGIL